MRSDSIDLSWWACTEMVGRCAPNPIATHDVDDRVVGNLSIPRNPVFHSSSCHPQTSNPVEPFCTQARAQHNKRDLQKLRLTGPDLCKPISVPALPRTDGRHWPPTTTCPPQPPMGGNSEKETQLLQIDPKWYAVHQTAQVARH